MRSQGSKYPDTQSEKTTKKFKLRKMLTQLLERVWKSDLLHLATCLEHQGASAGTTTFTRMAKHHPPANFQANFALLSTFGRPEGALASLHELL